MLGHKTNLGTVERTDTSPGVCPRRARPLCRPSLSHSMLRRARQVGVITRI